MSSHSSAESPLASLKRGVTFGEFPAGDLAYLFRRQYSRSLDEVDTLIRRQEYIKNQLGAEKAAAIEKEPDLFYNHERFRIWQAQARFRALLTTMVAFPAALTILNGGRDGLGFARRNRILAAPLFVGIYASSFFVWHRLVGYNNQSYYEQNYAKNVKMLRNIIIRQ